MGSGQLKIWCTDCCQSERPVCAAVGQTYNGAEEQAFGSGLPQAYPSGRNGPRIARDWSEPAFWGLSCWHRGKQMAKMSETWTFLDGDWHEGNVLVAGPRTHAFWLGSSVFDGARAFEGVTPDLDRHCERLNASASALGLKPTQSVESILGLVKDGLRRFHSKEAVYIRPMYWAEDGGVGGSSVPPNPETSR